MEAEGAGALCGPGSGPRGSRFSSHSVAQHAEESRGLVKFYGHIFYRYYIKDLKDEIVEQECVWIRCTK